MCSCEESMNTICCKLACNRFGGMALRRPNRRGKAARGKSSKRKSARAVAMTCESRDAIDKFESFLLEARRGSRFVGRDRPEENEKQKFSFACNSQRGSAIFTFFLRFFLVSRSPSSHVKLCAAAVFAPTANLASFLIKSLR
jgi:hypothetical protein